MQSARYFSPTTFAHRKLKRSLRQRVDLPHDAAGPHLQRQAVEREHLADDAARTATVGICVKNGEMVADPE